MIWLPTDGIQGMERRHKARKGRKVGGVGKGPLPQMTVL